MTCIGQGMQATAAVLTKQLSVIAVIHATRIIGEKTAEVMVTIMEITTVKGIMVTTEIEVMVTRVIVVVMAIKDTTMVTITNLY
jgi:hypothetical protein